MKTHTDVQIIKQGALGAAHARDARSMPWRMLRAQPKTDQGRGDRAAERALGAPGHAGEMGRRNRHRRDQRSSAASSRWAAPSSSWSRSTPATRPRRRRTPRNAWSRRSRTWSAACGAWLSTFTLAVTEVTERAQIPWLTLSYADSITDRGFKYVYQSSMPAGLQPGAAMPTILELAKAATGKAPATAGIIGDNTASPVAFLKPMREGGMAKLGIKILMDETYTPPLSDATPLIQKVRSTRPEFLMFISTTISDLKLGLEKMNEFRLAKGVVPVIANGAHMGAPEVLKNVPADLIEGADVHRRQLGAEGPGQDQRPVQEGQRRAVDHAGRARGLRPHLDHQGRRSRRPASPTR